MDAFRVKLLWIEGEDAEEFADLIGATGELRSRSPRAGVTFVPDDRGDWLTVAGVPAAAEGGRVRVRSGYTGLSYVFRKLDGA